MDTVLFLEIIVHHSVTKFYTRGGAEDKRRSSASGKSHWVKSEASDVKLPTHVQVPKLRRTEEQFKKRMKQQTSELMVLRNRLFQVKAKSWDA
jgi:hypothetical protein